VNVTILGTTAAPPAEPLWEGSPAWLVTLRTSRTSTRATALRRSRYRHSTHGGLLGAAHVRDPGLGINVPVASPPTVEENNSLCGTSPCVANTDDQAGARTGGDVQLHDPEDGRHLPWQCFVPCGGGYVDGNGARWARQVT